MARTRPNQTETSDTGYSVGGANASKPPEIALVLGSGASLLELQEHRDRLRKLSRDGHLHVIGVNYSYRFYITKQLLFLDWEMWTQNYYDLNMIVQDFGVQLVAPAYWDAERKERHPAPDLPPNTIRFLPFMCYYTKCPHAKGIELSDLWVKGLRASTTSVVAGINLAYLMNAKTIAMIGVEMDSSRHFWQTEKWERIKDTIQYHEKWQKVTCDVWGNPPEQKFPNHHKSRKDIKAIGEWIRAQGRRALNLATDPPGAVKGWDRMSIDALLTETERKIAKREYQREYRKRNGKIEAAP